MFIDFKGGLIFLGMEKFLYIVVVVINMVEEVEFVSWMGEVLIGEFDWC